MLKQALKFFRKSNYFKIGHSCLFQINVYQLKILQKLKRFRKGSKNDKRKGGYM